MYRITSEMRKREEGDSSSLSIVGILSALYTTLSVFSVSKRGAKQCQFLRSTSRSRFYTGKEGDGSSQIGLDRTPKGYTQAERGGTIDKAGGLVTTEEDMAAGLIVR